MADECERQSTDEHVFTDESAVRPTQQFKLADYFDLLIAALQNLRESTHSRDVKCQTTYAYMFALANQCRDAIRLGYTEPPAPLAREAADMVVLQELSKLMKINDKIHPSQKYRTTIQPLIAKLKTIELAFKIHMLGSTLMS
jgi:hypothetical protein